MKPATCAAVCGVVLSVVLAHGLTLATIRAGSTGTKNQSVSRRTPLSPAQTSASPVPAMITSVNSGGVGYVSVQQGSDGLNAQIGRWDAPFPGDYDPSLEPDGESTLTIGIDVNDGGLVSFDYQLKSYDAGIYDWLDIYLVTPSGTFQLENHLGKPGSDYGTFWLSPRISLSQNLSTWRNQHVAIVFSVQQDGYGDQTAADLSNLAIRVCRVPPLTQLTDATALSFEGGNTLDTSDLKPSLQTAVMCFKDQVEDGGGTFVLNSAYRPPPYQAHLREVWDKWGQLMNNTDPECQQLRSQVQTEFFTKHQLGASKKRPASPSGQHTQGAAIDVSVDQVTTHIPLNNFLAYGVACGLYRPHGTADKVHFELIGGSPRPFGRSKAIANRGAATLDNILPSDSVVTVYVSSAALPDGTVRYRYLVTNDSDQDLVSLSIGYDYHSGIPELLSAPVGWDVDAGIPNSSVASPVGWSADIVTTEELDFLSLDWTVDSSGNALHPGAKTAVFSVIADGFHDEFSSAHWTAILADGQAISRTLSTDYVVPLLNLSRAGQTVGLTFEGTAGPSYHLERTLSLDPSDWQSVPGVNDAQPTGTAAIELSDPAAPIGSGKAFYRVQLLP